MTLERGNSIMPVHAATLMWPTGIATGAGVVAGGLSFLVSGGITGPIATAIFFFALVGGGVALLGSKGDRRARRWAGQYPWRFAGGPAVLGGLGTALMTLLGAGGFFGAIFSGLAAAAVIWVILGVIGMVAGNKSA